VYDSLIYWQEEESLESKLKRLVQKDEEVARALGITSSSYSYLLLVLTVLED
jgi:hypothetical protein